MRTKVGFGLSAAVLLVAGCGSSHAATPQLPAASAPTMAGSPAASSSATPLTSDPDSPSGVPGTQTDPQRLDDVPLRPEELPGWQKAPAAADHAEIATEPADCGELYYLAPGVVASPMGSSVAYTQGDARELHQVADLVDDGARSIERAQELLGRCGQFTVLEEQARTPATATPMESPVVGENTKVARFTLGQSPVTQVVVVWMSHKDVLLTTVVQGESVDQQVALDAAAAAYQRLKLL